MNYSNNFLRLAMILDPLNPNSISSRDTLIEQEIKHLISCLIVERNLIGIF